MPEFLAKVFAALILVESEGNLWAVREKHGAYGCAQIRQMCLDDVNEYAGTNYVLTDFLGNYALSEWAFYTYGQRYKCKTAREYVRNWHRGKKGDDYVERVMRLYQEERR